MQKYLDWKDFELKEKPQAIRFTEAKKKFYALVVGKDDHRLDNPLTALLTIVVVHGFTVHRNIMASFES
jgi:hypothetical protein